MPSPVGHALGGVIVGLLIEGPGPGLWGQSPLPRTWRNWGQSPLPRTWRNLGWLAVAGCAPDADFLWGRHGAETHSLGAALLIGFVVLVITRGTQARLAAAVTLAWASHVLFDWLGSDDTPPLGVMALWPFTDAYYFAHAYVFEAISRRYWLPGFWTHNLMAVVREAAILAPIVAALVWLRRSVRSGSGHEN